MATLYVRNVPDDLYERLREEARASRRSINAEAIEVLRRGLDGGSPLAWEEVLRRAERARARSKRRPGSPSVVEDTDHDGGL